MGTIINIKGSINRQKVKDVIGLYFEDWDIEIDEIEGERLDLSILVNSDYSKCELYMILSDVIEEIIINECLDEIIKSRVKRIYKAEFFNINSYVIERIKDEIRISDVYLDEKIKMKDKLAYFLEENRAIDIDGYMRFRLKEYIYILDVAIDNIITEIKEEKQIKEFLDMIKYLVETHPAKEDVLHVILENGNFYFKDMDNNQVGSDIINKVESEFDTKNVTKSDILISSLILISPKKLVIHSDIGEKSFLITAIKEIFEDKVEICKGCNMCKND